MSIPSLLGLATFSRLTGRADDDWVDRLNHLYTVVILIIFALFVTGGQYVGSPIECWTPAHFTGAYVAYAKAFCWLRNTYYIPMSESIPVEHVDRESEELTYYQWVPIILMFMAFLFKLPSFIWSKFNGGSAINLDKIVNMTMATQIGPQPKRQETIRYIAQYMDRWLTAHQHFHFNALIRLRQSIAKHFFCGGKRDGKYLTGLYIFIKFLYALNAIAQLFILNAFMGEWFSMYGFEVLGGMGSDTPWHDSPRFPKITLCDFDIRQLENIQRYTVQCVLPINLFNEKIFTFLWFWILWTAIVTIGNLVFWLWRFLFRHNGIAYIRKYLQSMDLIRTEDDKRLARKFALNYLRDDGVFVLRLVARNSNDIMLSDLIAELWRIYLEKPSNKRPASGETDHAHEPEETKQILPDSIV